MAERTAFGALSLAGRYFTSETVYKMEWEQIFSKHWLCVGRSAQLLKNGAYFLAQIGAENLIVLRDYEGVVRAFFNVCRHRGTQLCEMQNGQLAHSIQCPYHAWTYGLNGRLLGAPNMQGVNSFHKQDFPLLAAGAMEWEGFIFVNLSATAVSFAQTYAPLNGKFSRWHLSELEVVERREYDVAANWKLIFQNYSECYHCPTLHPALNALTPYQDAENDLEEGPFLGGPMRLSQGNSSMTMNGRCCAAPLGEISGRDLGLVYYYTLFPTMFLSLHPDYVLTHLLQPLAVDRTRIICEWLFDPQSATQSNFDPAAAVDFWDMTNRQDWHVCELSQRGTLIAKLKMGID